VKTSDKILAVLQEIQSRRRSGGHHSISSTALETIHAERNKAKATCYWLGFLRGLIASDGIREEELTPLILHTEEFLEHFQDDDAEELLTEICNDWPSVTDEAEGVIENILEFREGEIDFESGYNAANYFNGFMKGIACDNYISEREVKFALSFLEAHPSLLIDPRASDIKTQMLLAISDDTISYEESDELCAWISRLVGDSFADTGLSSAKDIAATEDFEAELDMATLIGKAVVVTGVFSGLYTRQEFTEALLQIGVKVATSVSKNVDVLVVANEASKHWATHNAGTKLLAAHDLRKKHGKPLLVTEHVAIKALDRFRERLKKLPFQV
jgi:hypothetical protein